MKKPYQLVMLLLIQVSVVAGYSQEKKNMTTDAVLVGKVKQCGEKMTQALLKKDYATFATYTYPGIIRMIGGQSKMVDVLKKGEEDMKKQGIYFSAVTLGEPSAIVKSGNELQCTLPQHIDLKMKEGTLVATSTLIAISSDKGESWTFVDTSNKTIETLRKVLPNLSAAITIPPAQRPVLKQ